MRWLVRAVVTAALLTAVGACSSDQGVLQLLHLTNHADRVVDVFLLQPDTGQELMFQEDIGRGETSATRSDVYPGAACSSLGILIARDKQGTEIARRAGRICPGDTWVIEMGPRSMGVLGNTLFDPTSAPFASISRPAHATVPAMAGARRSLP